MRFNESQASQISKAAKEVKPQPKFGAGASKRQTDYSKLADAKKIPTQGGYK